MSRFEIISPVDGSVFAERNYATEHEIETVLEQAASAFSHWRRTPLGERIALCQAVVDYFKAHAEAWGEELSWQMGRPVAYTPNEIKGGFVERAQAMIAMAEQGLKEIRIPEKNGFTRYIKKEPLGTILVLAPWNYPYLTAVNAVIPAILAGNTVILKFADQTALCAERFSEAFEASGAQNGVFQSIHMTHDQVAKMVDDHRVAHVGFTGSVEGGKAVRRAIQNRFTGIGLELGGKDPAYVTEDVDLAQAVENLVDGAFFNSGQSCCGVERIYVHESRFDDFVTEFVRLTRQYKLGNPLEKETTLGPMVRVANARNAITHAEDAIRKGAKALIEKGEFPDHPLPYLAPQVLVNVSHEMLVMTEESFAPVVGIMLVKDDQEAIDLMNDSKYGLTASIWTKDRERAIRIGDHVDTGTWFMNRCDYLDPELSWSGVKDSGRGCTLSVLGFDYLTRPKSYHLKHG
ncbi:MAG: aldehyde dehydrogenase family protein [Cyclobacteriaceae bacterium]